MHAEPASSLACSTFSTHTRYDFEENLGEQAVLLARLVGEGQGVFASGDGTDEPQAKSIALTLPACAMWQARPLRAGKCVSRHAELIVGWLTSDICPANNELS